VQWALPGLYNARNAAMAATAAGLSLASGKGASAPIGDSPMGLSLAPLASFRGVKRRQEILFQSAPLTIIEDFGHHPTALAETMHSFRSRFPGATLTAAFEPRSNTARTKALQPGFMRALGLADEVYIGAVNRAEKLAEGDRFDPEAVAQHLEAQGVEAHFAATNDALLERLVKNTLAAPARKPRVVVFFSNGSFDGITARFAAQAKKAAS
jgi:UDP-N-acetylmuramate: L-alanyl-gamma-D-glutamyl-meso-diaminopimelate ligase